MTTAVIKAGRRSPVAKYRWTSKYINEARSYLVGQCNTENTSYVIRSGTNYSDAGRAAVRRRYIRCAQTERREERKREKRENKVVECLFECKLVLLVYLDVSRWFWYHCVLEHVNHLHILHLSSLVLTLMYFARRDNQ